MNKKYKEKKHFNFFFFIKKQIQTIYIHSLKENYELLFMV